MSWVLGGALFLGFLIGQILEARKGINQVTRGRQRDGVEADAAFRRRVIYEAESSRPK